MRRRRRLNNSNNFVGRRKDEPYGHKSNQQNFCFMHLILSSGYERICVCVQVWRYATTIFLIRHTCTFISRHVCMHAYATIFLWSLVAHMCHWHTHTLDKYNHQTTNDFIKQNKTKKEKERPFFLVGLVCVIVMECLTTTTTR